MKKKCSTLSETADNYFVPGSLSSLSISSLDLLSIFSLSDVVDLKQTFLRWKSTKMFVSVGNVIQLSKNNVHPRQITIEQNKDESNFRSDFVAFFKLSSYQYETIEQS